MIFDALPTPASQFESLQRLLSERNEESSKVKRERDEFAAALDDARSEFTRMANLQRLLCIPIEQFTFNLQQAATQILVNIADPSACLKAHDAAKDAQIRQLRNVLAEAARELISSTEACRSCWLKGESRACEIARFLGYKGEGVVTIAKVLAFLSSVSVGEPTV